MHEGLHDGVRAVISKNLGRAVRDCGPRLGIQKHTIIAYSEQARQFVTDHDDCYAEAVAQPHDQIVKVPGGYRVETC